MDGELWIRETDYTARSGCGAGNDSASRRKTPPFASDPLTNASKLALSRLSYESQLIKKSLDAAECSAYNMNMLNVRWME
ncbi:MAG: hypothetical protein LBL26_08190 [Peptococcaceae bacterium]|jgi:hypothetical protein|nr:hypothetical protein [Peptococcaceae bacterium]